MSVFEYYARYYDLMYKDKDYLGEVEYIHGILGKYGRDVDSIVDYGCGTGVHAALMANKGYRVHGIDQSADMLIRADERVKKLPEKVSALLTFEQADVRDYQASQEFDAVTALFHVMSYQASNEDLVATGTSAANQLEPGGIFLFDCWYGPAVLTDQPSVRVKRMEDEVIQVTRIAEPLLMPNDNLVDVKYTILIKEKATGKVQETIETHRMRYFFKPEIQQFLDKLGFELLHSEAWMTGQTPGQDTWSVCFVARQQG